LATLTEDEAFKAELYHRIFERRSQRHDAAPAGHDTAMLLERAMQINADVAQSCTQSTSSEAELEAQLNELEKRLTSRSEGLRWGAVPEEHQHYDSHEEYRKAVDAVLNDKRRKSEAHEAEEAASRRECERLHDLHEMTLYCRHDLVEGLLIEHGLMVHEFVRTAQRDAEMMALILADGKRREDARLAQEAESAANTAEREANYVACVDPVMRSLRQEAAARRQEEVRRTAAAEEAELSALEDRLNRLVSAGASQQTSSFSRTGAGAGARSVTQQRGATRVPYWKKQPPAEASAVFQSSDQDVKDAADPLASSVGSIGNDLPTGVVGPPTGRAVSPVCNQVDASEVSALLDVIDMAADEGNGLTGRGLGLLLSGIRV
jgi:hypothetical protein